MLDSLLTKSINVMVTLFLPSLSLGKDSSSEDHIASLNFERKTSRTRVWIEHATLSLLLADKAFLSISRQALNEMGFR